MVNKIGKTLFKKIFLWYTLVAMILTSYQIYNEYISYDKALKNSLHNIEMSFKKPLSASVWNLDDELIQVVMESMLGLTDVFGVLISDDREELIAKLGKTEDLDKMIFHSFKLNYENNYIGNVTLFSSKNIIFTNMKDNVFLILVNAFIKAFILMLVVYYFSNKIVTQVINKLIQTINNTNLRQKDESFSEYISEDNEIHTLINSFSNMKNRLQKEIKKNEELQYKKMETMSSMINNIAHQWRQPLSVISSAATGLKIQKKMNTLNDTNFKNAIDSINKSILFLNKIIEDFSTFLEFKDEYEKNCILKDSIDKVLDSDFFNSIRIIKNIEDITIKLNEKEFIKTLETILDNAKDALIKSKTDKKLIFINIYKKNDMVIIEICDNAGGIKEENINKIFDPYFTTKHQAQGTGLSLFMCQNTVKMYLNGLLDARNETYVYEDIEYVGAKFTVKLKCS